MMLPRIRSKMVRGATRVVVLTALLAGVAVAQASRTPDTTLVVSTAWMLAHAKDRNLVVLYVDRGDSAYRAAHIAGARFLSYADIQTTVDGIGTELPPVETLRNVFETLGVSDDSRVVITVGAAAPMATRAFFTLEYMGKRNVALLDGGLTAWRAAGGAVETGSTPTVKRGNVTPHPRTEIIASNDWMLSHLGKTGVSLIDTRTINEYDGIGDARLPSEGHLEGARRLEWQETMRDKAEFSPRPLAELQRMWGERVAPGDTVATYCLVGYRGSYSYFVSRYLGYPVKLYDGSYDEWSKKKLPLVKTPTPLRTP